MKTSTYTLYHTDNTRDNSIPGAANTRDVCTNTDHAIADSREDSRYIESADAYSDYVYIFLLKYQLRIHREYNAFDLAAS